MQFLPIFTPALIIEPCITNVPSPTDDLVDMASGEMIFGKLHQSF